MEEDDIAAELKQQGVTHVKRIPVRKGDQIIKTGTHILTFNLHELPDRLFVGYLSVSVDRYVPNPLRCYNCQKFGHGAAGCKNRTVCCNCGEDGHEPVCTRPLKCCKCSGNHAASSKECPLWIKEKEIQRLRTVKKISYPEARKQVEGFPSYKFQQTYASVVKPIIKTIDCQTDLTWMNTDKPHLIKVLAAHSRNKNGDARKQPVLSQSSGSQTTAVIDEPSQPPKERKKATSAVGQVKPSRDGKAVNLKDVNMKEASTSRGRSSSPKSRTKGQVPVLPP